MLLFIQELNIANLKRTGKTLYTFCIRNLIVPDRKLGLIKPALINKRLRRSMFLLVCTDVPALFKFASCSTTSGKRGNARSQVNTLPFHFSFINSKLKRRLVTLNRQPVRKQDKQFPEQN